MKKSLILASVLAILSAGTAARADDDDCYVPMSKWQPKEAVRSMAERSQARSCHSGRGRNGI